MLIIIQSDINKCEHYSRASNASSSMKCIFPGIIRQWGYLSNFNFNISFILLYFISCLLAPREEQTTTFSSSLNSFNKYLNASLIVIYLPLIGSRSNRNKVCNPFFLFISNTLKASTTFSLLNGMLVIFPKLYNDNPVSEIAFKTEIL